MSKRHKRSRIAEDDIPDDDIIILDEPDAEVEAAETPPAADPDPLEVLRREVDEHKSARAEAERKLTEEKAERERATQAHQGDKLAQDRIVIEQAYSAAETRSVAAKRAFTDAMTAGDFAAAAEAQAAIARVENEMQRYADAYQGIEERARATPEPQRQQAPAPKPDASLDAAIAQIPDPATRQWATDHKDDLKDPARLKLAYAADALAIARGMKPGTDAYLDFLDDQLGYEMEEIEERPAPAPPPRATPAKRRAPPVAAPVSRGGGGKVSVTLSATDKAFAQQLGVSEKEYAKSVIGAKSDPRFTKYQNRLR